MSDRHNAVTVMDQGAEVVRGAASDHKTFTLNHRYDVECVRWYHGETQCIDHGCPGRDKAIGTCTPKVIWSDVIDNLVVTTGLNHYLSRAIRGALTGGATNGYNDGRISPVPWTAATAYSVGDVVMPTPSSKTTTASNRMFICITAGTSGALAANEPVWPIVAGGEVADATVRWLEMSRFFVGLVTSQGGGNTYSAADTMASHAGWPENTASYAGVDPAGQRKQYVPAAPSAGSTDNGASKASFAITATATIAGAFVSDMPGRTSAGIEQRSQGLLFGVGNFTGGDKAVASGDTLNVTVTVSLS